MNSKDFIKVLRTIINEEVRKVIREELSKLKLSESTVNKTPIPNQKPVKEAYVPGTMAKKYVSDPLLNSILNETANTPEPEAPPVSITEKSTGNEVLDEVFTRDYSKLVATFNKK